LAHPKDFVDLHDIVKQHAKKDLAWTAEIEKVANMVPGQVQNFNGTPDQGLNNVTIVKGQKVKYRARAVEVKEIFSAPMDQHRFPYANTCEELFIKWSEYEKIHPLQ
jgi:hypothetical protein